MNRFVAFALTCVFLAAATFAAAAEDKPQVRIALVIGNSDYKSERIPHLKNPVNDSEDVARALKGFGFTVDLEQNLDQAAMTAAMTAFATQAHSADVALFYYAGHGLQLDLRNYLVPTDAEYTTQEDVINRSVALDTLTGAAEGMTGSLLIFLDACQENPLGERDGLARIPVARNQFVALAALPDNRAADGAGRNSPFSEAFLTNAGVPGRNISDVMLKVRVDVLAATGSQVPWDNSSLTQEVVFVPGDAASLPPETMLWRTASSLGDPALINVYLEKFPDGAHVPDAKLLLASATTSSTPEGDFRSTGGIQGDEFKSEEELWSIASSSRWRPLLEVYAKRFPKGAHLAEAHELMSVLQDPNDPDQPPEFTCERLTTHPNDETPSFAGVPASRLRENAKAAIDACRLAHAKFPEVHKYTAFLARALVLAGQTDEGIALFREAAMAGNIRAITTLGALYETGTGVAPDPAKAAEFYSQAANLGAADATVNLASMLAEGKGVKQDIQRAVKLLEGASDAGSEQAAFNLGVLAMSDRGLSPTLAQKYFVLASDRGYIKSYFRAAVTYETDEFGVRDPKRAADYLLRAVASDNGDTLVLLQGQKVGFSADTMTEVQKRLTELNYYHNTVDGRVGRKTIDALRVYRFGGVTTP